jgi:IclR family pca regulon transcriptional regulator
MVINEQHPAKPIARQDLVECLGKGLRVIEAFDDDHARLTPTEIGQRCGITRTAARRYLLSLCHFGYAATDGRQYWLLPRVLRLGHSYLVAARLPRLVQQFIQRISLESGETVNFSVLDGHEVVYVARSNSPRLVSVGFHPGARAPAHVVAPGAAMLATLDDAQLDQWIAEHQFSVYTPDTTSDPVRFRQQVETARTRGYAVTEQQLDSGLRGIALALKDRHGTCVGAIGITTPTAGATSERAVAQLVPLLQDTAVALRPLL